MKQNNSTELLGYSKFQVYNKNASRSPQGCNGWGGPLGPLGHHNILGVCGGGDSAPGGQSLAWSMWGL